jgi:hypothetical protein
MAYLSLPLTAKHAVHRRSEIAFISLVVIHKGAVAQLGERRVRNAKVGSSILLRSTIPHNCGRVAGHCTS